ncbi:hypothetical protein BFP97_11655 [Roseivirga sp. 4D4]|uniref:nuclear transport factor 2 family protein n=1 Tax=Roseivirga sp. 4D4 TaxID=1889784 RepID=UPI000852AF0B|nr:nuclear transport factor 2 family protein [Roseivirga sp. 4D4]OEK02137.1 hypothetical protein BFP97_11655 [Roseivirga sp. 4D4]
MSRTHLLLSLLLVLSLGCQQTLEKGTEKDLMTTLDKFNLAFAEGDLDFLDRHTTSDYRHTNNSNKAFGKTSWFEYLTSRKEDLNNGVLNLQRYEMSEIEVQLYENSAVITGLIYTKGNHYSEAFDRQLRVTHLWVFQEGIWKRAAFHDTPIE